MISRADVGAIVTSAITKSKSEEDQSRALEPHNARALEETSDIINPHGTETQRRNLQSRLQLRKVCWAPTVRRSSIATHAT